MFEIDMQIAWRMGSNARGEVMAGKIIAIGHQMYMVECVNGAECCVPKNDCWLATNDDIETAERFFVHHGSWG